MFRQATDLFKARFGAGPDPSVVSIPGRINLIGEHIDYHDLPVLPMAIQRCVWIAFRPGVDPHIRAVSAGSFGDREFSLASQIEPSAPGDWANYLKAAAQATMRGWEITRGIDAAIASDLPAAAGLSSSSALITGFAIALLQANGIRPTLRELLDVLPEAEHFTGTRGGAMDHAAILASQSGCALLIEFEPLTFSPIPIPNGWSFLVAHSLTTAEKSGDVRRAYNARRTAAFRALQQLGLPSYSAALEAHSRISISRIQGELELAAFRHVVSEALRVRQAVEALRGNDPAAFGKLLTASHVSLRDDLRVSSPALDSLVETALDAGAEGARLTGAGFGGCVIILCTAMAQNRIREQLISRYYSQRDGFDAEKHLFIAEASQGALVD